MAVHDRQFFEGLTCPVQVTWTNDIQQLFTAMDIAHMKQVTRGSLDLGSYDSVKVWAAMIYSRLSDGSMPPPGSGEAMWTPAMLNTFGCWIQQGTPR
jgi:hypothetical protein